MLNNSNLIQPENLSRLDEIISHQGTNFGDLVNLSGLSKTEDFLGADLCGVDFSDTDLRGFDFSNADLTGCRGINVSFDHTTILKGAKVDGSLFALEQEKRNFLEADEEQRILFDNLRNRDWASGAIWMGDNLKKTSKNFANASKIAKYLYKEVLDQSYKNQILYGLRGTFTHRSEYRDFLINQISDPNVTYRSIRGVLDILGRSFGNDPLAKSILFDFLHSENKEIRKVCIPAVVSENIFHKNKDVVSEAMMAEPDADLRRLYTKTFCELHSSTGYSLLYSNTTKSFFDYNEEINNLQFENMIRSALYTKKLLNRADKVIKISKFSQEQFEFGINIDRDDIILSSLDFDDVLSYLSHLGLPLKITYKRDEYEKSRKQLLRRIVG